VSLVVQLLSVATASAADDEATVLAILVISLIHSTCVCQAYVGGRRPAI
jgi:hypothetical protein